MLLVDTSGSMERIPDDGSNPNCDNCVPQCTGDTMVDRNNKTRWALTVEALTGTIQNYQCRSVDRSTYLHTEYDYGYYLPHIDFSQGLTQATDGILDSFGTRVKFGLMTFDGVGTTLGGDTLVPYHTWFDDAGFLASANGAAGMYSYGDVGRLAFPGCITDYGINAGARGEGNFDGALISIPASDAVDDVLAANGRIQDSLTRVRPFGGTPIAGMLDDLRYYLENNRNINSAGDLLYECRQRKAILITDGAPDAMFRDTRFNCGIEETYGRQASCTAPNTHPNAAFPSPGCSCPYQQPSAIAHQLTGGVVTSETQTSAHLLQSLIVVAYNVHDPVALDGLETIAASGATVGDQPDARRPHLIQADGAGELRQKLDLLLNASQPGVTSRSTPISITVADTSAVGNTKRFDITAGFQVGRNTSEAWQGLLYRGRSVCQGTTVSDEPFSTTEGDVFHEVLTQQASAGNRKLITVTPSTYGPVDGTLINSSYLPNFTPIAVKTSDLPDQTPLPTNWDPTNVRLPLSGDFSTGELSVSEVVSTVISSQGARTTALNAMDVNSPNFIDANVLNPQYFGDATHDNIPGRTDDRTAVVNFTLGRGRPNALADIYHSQPIGMLPINQANASRFATIDARYTSWLRALISTGPGAHYEVDGRPGVVFVGTNDGVLHAFNLDTWRYRGATYGGGQELWGFVPPAIFGKMASMGDSHQIGFDGSPEVKDVVLQRVGAGEPIYRSILVSAIRGAHAFVALDVTFPEAPSFLWQFSAPDVGNTIGNVALTQVSMNWPGAGTQVRAVAILPGGEGSMCPDIAVNTPALPIAPTANKTRAQYPTSDTRSVRCWNRRGRSLYVVDVATGRVLQEFGPSHFPSPLTGSVVVDNPGVATSTAAYFFDHDGILWRLSMMSLDPHDWRVTPAYDMFANPPTPDDQTLPTSQLGRRPMYAPTLVRDNKGNLVILAGTGDVDSPRDTARHRIISLTEKRGPLVNGEITAVMELNWHVDLNQNEAVTGPLTVFQDVVYFGTFESGATDLCGLGTSRMWGAHAYQPLDVLAPEGQRVATPRLMRRGAGPADPFVLSEDYNNNSLILGVTVKQQPICQSSARLLNAATQQSIPTAASGGGAFQLTGVMAGGSSGGLVRGGDTGRGAVVETNPQTIRTMNQSKVTSWASMFE
jgi:type IV pilus assembly protein PilY1